MTDVIHLSTDALVQAINDEYAAILVSERSNLAKALAIGEKLAALRPRIAPKHGEWKPALVEHCPEISYETAAVYIRIYTKQAEWRKAAAEKHADPTCLTIEGVLKLLRPDRPDGDSKSTGTSKATSKPTKGGVQEPGMEQKSVSVPPDEQVNQLELDYGDMFEVLKLKYDQDELTELTKLLATQVGMVLMPISQSKALYEAIGAPAPV